MRAATSRCLSADRSTALVAQSMKSLVTISLALLVAAELGTSPARAVDPRQHPALANAPRITHAPNGAAGDPVNIAFIGSEEDLHLCLLSAKWAPADPITLKSSMRIVGDTVFRRSYIDAPVSNLLLWGRKQDFAFEQPVGKDPRQRHHVRFWRADKVDSLGRPLWVGAATYDTRVGFKQRSVKVTHHIAPDVDTERDKVIRDARETGDLVDFFWVDGFHEKVRGKNGGGDPWFTDGRLAVGVIMLHNRFTTKP
jgi:hypothetical protein